MKQTILKVIHRLGFHAYRWPSDRHVVMDYPVRRLPRYGYGKPLHRAINAIIAERRDEFERVLREIGDLRVLIEGIAFEPSESNATEPHWNQGWLPPRDAAAIMYFILRNKSRRYLEIGSGNSTKFARRAVRHGGLDTIITSIDPHPREEIDTVCDRVIRCGLQDADLSLFDELEAGDVVSFDGSHSVFMDSDVSVFFLEIVPKLKAGIFVHVHDIFWPLDYPPHWVERYYSEQYMLGMLILYGRDSISIELSNVFIDQDPELRALAASVIPSDPAQLGRLGPGLQGPGLWGNSFWFQTTKPLTDSQHNLLA